MMPAVAAPPGWEVQQTGAVRGLLVIGHGSRRDEANATVFALAEALADEPAPGADGRPAWEAVEAAFLDVLRPTIADGYAELVDAGCTEIVAHPFFLFAGKHTAHDIPAALAAARARHPQTTWLLTDALGLHPGVVSTVRARIADALADQG
jgi:sirohydrochlorin cobaltochelatase